jgi:hypothetical protein
MATGQTLLNICEDVFPELQLQSGQVDVAKGLRALNVAQDLFETVIATHSDVLGSDISTVTTTNNTESTTFPSTLLRLDGLDFIDPDTSRPAWPLIEHKSRGGHAWRRFWPWSLISTSSTGRPLGYWTDGSNIYWDPLPNGTHTVRWYGFAGATDITAGGTFLYPDQVMFPIVIFAVRVLKTGVDDPVPDYVSLAQDTFQPLVKTLSRFKRDTAMPLVYRFSHDT